MEGYQARHQQSEAPTGVGCALVFPVAFFGMLMIADYPGPPGRFGFAEFFGWGAVCVATAYCSARFLLRFQQRVRMRFLFLFFGLATPAVLGLLLWWDIQPSTPTEVKQLVEYSLQVVGVLAIIGMVTFIAGTVRKSRR